MSERISYNHGQIDGSITDIKGYLAALGDVKDDVQAVFLSLHDVYEGEGQTALQANATQINQLLDDAIHQTVQTQISAEDQNHAMSALDKANANDF